MISKATSKFINSLQLKKYRQEYRKFIVEGKKSIQELLKSDFSISELYLSNDAAEGVLTKSVKTHVVSKKEIERISTLKSNNFGVAVVEMRPEDLKPLSSDQIYVALDNIQDPGNLGTIIRACDWYGIGTIICSKDTVDCYNPKVVGATMGGIFRVNIKYVNLKEELGNIDMPVYGAILGGVNLHEKKSLAPGVLLMGNESKGVSEELRSLCSTELQIPSYGQAESLNVAMATTILLDNFKRLSLG